MNNKVSIILRALAIVLSAGAIALFFLIKGEMDNAVAKAKPLAAVAKTSGDPYNYQDRAKPKDLRAAMEIVAPACNEIEKRREQKLKDDATMAAQKNTIAQRDATIADLNGQLDARDAEIAELTRTGKDLEDKLNAVESKLAAAEATLRAEKENTARLNERIANMKTLDEYNARLDEIADLQKKMENGQNRYTKFRHFAKAKGLTFTDEEYPSALYITSMPTGPVVKFASPYIPTTVYSIDARRGLVVLSVGTTESYIMQGGYYDVEFNGIKVGQIQIAEASPASVIARILPKSDMSAVANGATVNLIPFVNKK